MKIAVTGKGGAGKTTFSVFLSLFMSAEKKVTVIDGDSTMNLPVAFGLPPEKIKAITPLSEMSELIQERTGAKPGVPGSFFKMNPVVDDLPDKIGISLQSATDKLNDIRLIVMGTIAKAGGGCACSENVLLRAFLSNLFFGVDDILILDMEAGLEHLGRSTIENVDAVLAVTEPDSCSIDVAKRVLAMSEDLGIKHLKIVANKIASDDDEAFLREHFSSEDILGSLPFDSTLRRRSQGLVSFDDIPKGILSGLENIKNALKEQNII